VLVRWSTLFIAGTEFIVRGVRVSVVAMAVFVSGMENGCCSRLARIAEGKRS
jgi:hypothetical protein